MSRNGSYLTRESILAVDDLKYEDVDVPGWGGTVRIRELDAAERNKMGVEFASGPAGVPPDFYAKICALVIVDDKGKPVFKPHDIDKLGQKSFESVQKIVDACLRISGMTDEAVQELGKDSEGPPIEDSPSP